MKLGIIARIDRINQVPTGDKINYIKAIADAFRQNHDLVLIDWRAIDNELNVSRHLLCTKEGITLQENPKELEELCDLLFLKQLGKIHQEKEAFLKFLNSLDKFRGRITNKLQAIKNNLSKQYLLDLQEKGLPIIPTQEVKEDATLQNIKTLDFNSEDVVLKPKEFGEQGYAVKRASEFNDEEEFQRYKKTHSPLLTQPFIKEIKEKGEISYIYLGKEFIHAVKKFTGEFKINCKKGIKCTAHTPSEKELAICQQVLETWPNEFDYIRVDLIPHEDSFLISEVELVNPAFYIENVLSLKDSFIKKLESFLSHLK